MGGPSGISGNSGSTGKIGYTTKQDLEIIKKYADQQFAAQMSMQGSIMTARIAQLRAAMQQNGQNGQNGTQKASLSDNITNAAKSIIDTYKNVKGTNTETPSNTPSSSDQVSNNSSGAGNAAQAARPQVRSQAPAGADGASYSGLAKGVDTGSGAYDMSALNSVEHKLSTNSYLSIEDLTSMQNEISMKKVDIADKLSAAQADYSNVQGQYETAQGQVTELQGAVGEAETQKTDAKRH